MGTCLSVVQFMVAASPAIVLLLPLANTCDAQISYDYTRGWSAICVGDCNVGEGTCGAFQSGEPVGPAVPITCICSGSGTAVVCAMQWWIHSQTGGWLGAGCRFPGQVCGPDDPTPKCTPRPAPEIPPAGPVPLWDSCSCQ